MNSIMKYVGFAIKSGAIIKGADDILKSKKKAHLILMVESTQANSKHKIIEHADKKGVKISIVEDKIIEQLNLKGVKILAITDKNLATAIINSIN